MADPLVEEAAEQCVLESAVDDALGETGALGEVLVVVDLVLVAGAGGPEHMALGVAVLDDGGDFLAGRYVFEVDVCHLFLRVIRACIPWWTGLKTCPDEFLIRCS